jgi:hypothetical protein
MKLLLLLIILQAYASNLNDELLNSSVEQEFTQPSSCIKKLCSTGCFKSCQRPELTEEDERRRCQVLINTVGLIILFIGFMGLFVFLEYTIIKVIKK